METEAETVDAREWLAAFLKRHEINWDGLTPAQRLLLTREIPCYVRCWRVGVSSDCKPCEVCPECGQLQPGRTAWEKVPLPV
jgi:hypothetical protein